jgi:hypothetical protein
VRCGGITQQGTRCERSADGPNGLCWLHDPMRSEDRRRAASRGGKGKQSRELIGLKGQLRDLTSDVLSGELETGCAAVANQLLNTQLRAIELQRKIIEQEEIMERLEALERAADTTGSRWRNGSIR